MKMSTTRFILFNLILTYFCNRNSIASRASFSIATCNGVFPAASWIFKSKINKIRRCLIHGTNENVNSSFQRRPTFKINEEKPNNKA